MNRLLSIFLILTASMILYHSCVSEKPSQNRISVSDTDTVRAATDSIYPESELVDVDNREASLCALIDALNCLPDSHLTPLDADDLFGGMENPMTLTVELFREDGTIGMIFFHTAPEADENRVVLWFLETDPATTAQSTVFRFAAEDQSLAEAVQQFRQTVEDISVTASP